MIARLSTPAVAAAMAVGMVAMDAFALEIPKQRNVPSPPSNETPQAVAAEDTRAFVDDPEGGEISIEGAGEPLVPFTYLTLTFPRPMVADSVLDQEAPQAPVVFWPGVATEFTWRTPTSGDLVVLGPLIPDQEYRLRIREGLVDAEGVALEQDVWGVRFHSPRLRLVEAGAGERSSLSARPQVPLSFNYAVDVTSIPQGAWFQDRATRERFELEVFLNAPTGEVIEKEARSARQAMPDRQYAVRVRPKEPLPPGRTVDLVVDEVRDIVGGRTLPYPVVIPLGTTRPMQVDFVAARAFPLETPRIVVKFTDTLADGPLPEGAVRITPEVPGQTVRKEGQEIIVEGEFSTTGRYVVEISGQVTGERGYGLAKAETWGATFRGPRPAVIFPDRSLRMRPESGLRFAFMQCDTGPLTWRLAPLPSGRLREAGARLREFDTGFEDEERRFTSDGYFAQPPTELLVDSLGLKTVAEGGVDASVGENLREIVWQSAEPFSGPYLLEVSGKDAQGRLVGNRAIIYFADLALTRKQASDSDTIRVARLSDGLPTPGARVDLLDRDGRSFAQATADEAGLASFPPEVFAGCAYLTADASSGKAWLPREMASRFPGGSPSFRKPSTLRGTIFTDRPLYRPGQVVHFKGFVREAGAGGLEIPADAAIEWQVQAGYSREVVATGRCSLSPEGGWHGEWTPDLRLGEFRVVAMLDGTAFGEAALLRVEEFRNPPFSVVCKPAQELTPGNSSIEVSSQLFHGAPNSGARVVWKATWVGDNETVFADGDGGYDPMLRTDPYSEHARQVEYLAEVGGEAVLDAEGRVTVRASAPFPDPGNRASSRVIWKVDVTGADGQTITGGTSVVVPMAGVLYGLRTDETEPGFVLLHWDAREMFGDAGRPTVNLYHVRSVSVKERVAPGVYRYRNSDLFEPAGAQRPEAQGELRFPVGRPGRYVAVLTPPPGGAGIPVSAEAYVPGPGEVGLPVESETEARVLRVDGGTDPEGRAWRVGETAELSVIAPSPGIAWVSVETDRILDSFTLPLDGNSGRLSLPIKDAYEPDAFVTVYILRPGGAAGLAGEMFGSARLEVEKPGRNLAISVEPASASVQPRAAISGVVRVTADGLPVEGADLAIYAVDDSILELGGWSLPNGFRRAFFPQREHHVMTYAALENFVDGVERSWLTAKGFVVGDGGEEEFSNTEFQRREFKPLILWLPSVRTDADGAATFTCDAPDNLTRFRFIAVGQTRACQFGAGDATVEVRKPLMIEPALPRFLREGDELRVRAVVRQSEVPELAVEVGWSGNGSVAGNASSPIKVSGDKPAVVAFSTIATEVGNATLAFRASSSAPALSDAVEITLPVLEPVALLHEAVGGEWEESVLDAGAAAPAHWANGTYDLLASTSPYMRELAALPRLIEYPHGCFEQKSGRLLGLTELSGLLSSLPSGNQRRETYSAAVEGVLQEFQASLLPGGMLPYWPGGTTPSIFVTVQAAWGMLAADEAGFQVPERLAADLEAAVREIAEGRIATTPTLRAFALFVLARALPTADGLGAIASDLFLRRDSLSSDGKAFLAMAMQALGRQADARRELLRGESDLSQAATGNPDSFSSSARSRALRLWAEIGVNGGSPASAAEIGRMLADGADLSTQENLWLLLAFKAEHASRGTRRLDARTLQPPPASLSPDATGASWKGFADPAQAVVSGLPRLRTPGSFVLAGRFRAAPDAPAEEHGIRLERVVFNRTDPKRTGTQSQPLKLGDEILISYRFSTSLPRHFLALVDALPAALEILNPSIANAESPQEPDGTSALALSHHELRDAAANLYFDSVPKGSFSTALRARVTAAGSFSWPATQISPMYDARVSGRTASSRIYVTE